MSYLPAELFSADVEWEQAFWDATEAPYPERNDTDSNELASAYSFFIFHPTKSFPLGEIVSFEANSNELVSPDDHKSVRTAKQCRSHLTKGKRRRNRKDKDWLAIDRHVKARKEAGKESDVYLDKQLIDPRKLQKNTSRPRFMQPFDKYGNTPLPPVPPDFEIKTPKSQDDIPTWSQELPFMQFRNLLLQDATPHIYPSEFFNRSSDLALHHTVTIMHSQIVLPKLEALLPAHIFRAYSADAPEAGLRLERASGAYLDLLSFSISNNFTALDDLPAQRALDYLKSQSSTNIARLMQSITGQTGRALAEKLFVCAIEAKDSSIVELILQHHQKTKVDPNKSICRYHGLDHTPIELSAGLRDIETTRVLLKYGADVNKTFEHGNSYTDIVDYDSSQAGALSCALRWNFEETSPVQPVQVELVELLIEHGASVNTHHLHEAIKSHTSEAIQLIFQAGGWKQREMWGMYGMFGKVISALDAEAATRFVDLLKRIGADINAPRNGKHPTMLDMAAQRGDLNRVQMLLRFGAIETETTLSYAIQGRNMTVVDIFLNERRANSLSCDRPPTTPYAEAIRMGDARIVRALAPNGTLKEIKHVLPYLAALGAASEVGNTEVLEHLLRTRPKMDLAVDLGLALCTAAEANHTKAVMMLIDAGADYAKAAFRLPERTSTPLQSALKNQNPEIVRALLNLRLWASFGPSPLLAPAVKWGNISIIEDLLVAGCDINETCNFPEHERISTTPLITAVSNRNQMLVYFLLGAGADVNQLIKHGRGIPDTTALSAAVQTEDIDMIRALLSMDADPGDPVALLISCQKGGEIFHLLIETFLKRHPNGKRGCCDHGLRHAIRNNDPSILESLSPLMTLQIPGYDRDVGKLLTEAIQSDNPVSLGVVRMLLDSGVNPDTVIDSPRNSRTSVPCSCAGRMSLLSAAIEEKNFLIVNLLLEKGADVNFPATRGIQFTPIQRAAMTGCYGIVLKLIDRGADFDAPAAEVAGGTAIQLAAIGGFVGIVDLLVKKGAKINRPPSKFRGRTALEGAAEHGRLDMVHFLLQSEARIDGPGREPFLRAMELAERNGHFVVLELLQSYAP